MAKRTSLFETHQKLGGRIVDFAGWDMPVQYSGILEEHQAVRQAAGLFDIAHMGQINVTGAQAAAFLNWVLSNDIRKLKPGLGQYTHLCMPSGGVVDDLYIYEISQNEFLLIVNASRFDNDWAWLNQSLRQFPGTKSEVQLRSLFGEWGAVAPQGPKAVEFVDSIFSGPTGQGTQVTQVRQLKKNQITSFVFDGVPVWVARTGYTGEDGFEIMAPNTKLPALWNALLAAGSQYGIKPAGLGARDTLRTEAGYPLYGHELDENTSPVEAGLSRFIGWDKADFVGRKALLEQKEKGVTRMAIAFIMTDKAPPPRPHYVLTNITTHAPLGIATSGTQSPSMGIGIGLGFVPPAHAQTGTAIAVEIRGKYYAAKIVAKPIFRKEPAPVKKT